MTGFFQGLILTPEMFEAGYQVVGMVAFRIGLIVAAVIIAIDTIVSLYRLVRAVLRGNSAPYKDFALTG